MPFMRFLFVSGQIHLRYQQWMKRGEWNSHGPIVLMQPFLVLRLGCDRRLLDWLAFVSIGFEEVPATWSATMPAMYQKENIAISASISVQIIMQPCSRSPNYGMTRCRVPEISVVLYMKPTEPVVVQRSCLNQAYPKYRLNNRSTTVSMWIPVKLE